MIEPWRLPPQFTDLDAANAEIKSLYHTLHRERELLAKQIERRVLDNRASAGNLRAVREENAELRKQLGECNGRHSTT